LSDLNTFTLGEVMHSETSYVANYQTNGMIDGLLDYPLYYKLLNVFTMRQPISTLEDHYVL